MSAPTRPPGDRVLIRDAAEQDWAGIWPFFRTIVAAGETYCWPTDMMGADGRAAWFGGPRTTVLVAVDTADRDGGGYVSVGGSPIVGRIVGTVPGAFRHPRDGYVGPHVMYRAL